MSQRINVNLYPKDGYFFKEKDGAVLRGTTWPGVMRRVEHYRRRAGYPIGNVEQEVIQQACARNPSHCVHDDSVTVNQRKIVSLKGRVLQWLGIVRKARTQLKFVSPQEAGERANACAGCPKNTPLPEGCATCRAALNAMRNEILGPHRAKDGRLNGCIITGCDLPTDVHLESDRISLPEAPDFCWRKRTL